MVEQKQVPLDLVDDQTSNSCPW